MSQNKLIISLKTVAASTEPVSVCPSAYEVNTDKGKKKRALLDNLDVVEVDIKAYTQNLAINLNKANSWRFNINTDRLSEKQRRDIEKFWFEHPLSRNVVPNDDEVSMTDSYLYEFTDETITADKQIDDRIIEVYTKFKALDESQRKSVAIYFGQPAYEMNSLQVERTMIALPDGILTTNQKAAKEFLTDVDSMFNPTLLNLNLAITYNILRSDGEVYHIAGTTIGRVGHVSECLFTLSSKPDLYAQLLRDISSSGKIPFGSAGFESTDVQKTEAKKSLPAAKK